jgi:hypothetical protein
MLAVRDHPGDHSESGLLTPHGAKLSAQIKDNSLQSDHSWRDHSGVAGRAITLAGRVIRASDGMVGRNRNKIGPEGDFSALVGAFEDAADC